jgi:hypothetical protein
MGRALGDLPSRRSVPHLPLMANEARANRRRSRRQETRLANDTGARVQRGSGSLPWAKGDVRKRGIFRAECKFTKKKSFSVTRTILDKIRSECDYNETPVLDVTFVGEHGATEDHWVCVPYETWLAYQREHDGTTDDT